MESYIGLPDGENLIDDLNEACQRNIIRNLRAALENPQDVRARGELVWAAAMAENGMLIIGKDNGFQAHMLEHQAGRLYGLQPRPGAGGNSSGSVSIHVAGDERQVCTRGGSGLGSDACFFARHCCPNE